MADTSTRQVLSSEKLDEQFHKNGFVKFPLFSKKQINEIKAFYDEIVNEHNVEKGRAFHTTLNTSNRELIHKVNKFLRPYFENTLPKHLKDCKLTIGGFLVKDHGKDSTVTIHQDWTFVDESKFTSFNLWVSLEDTNFYNGNMQFVPGSHQFSKSLRISPDIPGYFVQFPEKAAGYLVDVPSKAGECVMFNQAVIHASRKNLSGKQRVSCVISAYPVEADLLHFYLPKGEPLTKIEKHRITAESMIELKKDQRPSQSELLGYVSYEPTNISPEEFEKKCREFISPIQKCKSWFLDLFLGKSC